MILQIPLTFVLLQGETTQAGLKMPPPDEVLLPPVNEDGGTIQASTSMWQISTQDAGTQTTICSSSSLWNVEVEPHRVPETVSRKTQTDNPEGHVRNLFGESEQVNSAEKTSACPYMFSRLSRNKNKFKYFTGLSVYKFLSLYKFLGPQTCSKLKYCNHKNVSTPIKERNFKLTDKDMLIILLMRLRRGFTYQELAYFFDISQTQISVIVYTWTQFLYVSFLPLKEGMFVSKEQVKKQKLPFCFKFFKNVRVVLDCTEFKREHPSNFEEQGNTFSQYKNDNTYKCLLGIVPKGSFCFVSDCYEGSISDYDIFMQCGIVEMLRPHDVIMVDRGFDVQADMDPYNVKVVIPPFLKQRSRLTPQEEIYGKRVSRARGHVERAIRRLKSWKLLGRHLSHDLSGMISQIVFVTACLVNFERPILT